MELAFERKKELFSVDWCIQYGVDFVFLIEILVQFNTMYFDQEFQLISSRKLIAKRYIQSWFIIDLMAILPIQLLIGTDSDVTSMVRFTRVGRIVKMFKMTKLLRFLKVMGNKNTYL